VGSVRTHFRGSVFARGRPRKPGSSRVFLKGRRRKVVVSRGGSKGAAPGVTPRGWCFRDPRKCRCEAMAAWIFGFLPQGKVTKAVPRRSLLESRHRKVAGLQGDPGFLFPGLLPRGGDKGSGVQRVSTRGVAVARPCVSGVAAERRSLAGPVERQCFCRLRRHEATSSPGSMPQGKGLEGSRFAGFCP
jgi:hypothetical protein